jgi:plasmid stabilization system protein ParE
VTTATGTRTWTLEIPAPAKMYSENADVHWRFTRRAAKAWRQASFDAATEAGLPQHLGRVRIDVVLHFGDNRDRDNYNYHRYVAKPLVDGLARPRAVNGKRGPRTEPGYQLVDDDNPRYVDGPFITIGAKVPRKELPNGLAVITITDSGESTLPPASGAEPVRARPARQCECGTTYYGSAGECASCRRRREIVDSLLDEDGAGEAAVQLRRDRTAVYSAIATSMMGTNRSPSIAAVVQHINAFRRDQPITEYRVRAVVDTLTSDKYLSYENRKFKILKPLGAAA